MIRGIGIDIVELLGFAEQLDDRCSSFSAGSFTERERADVSRKASSDKTRHFAARYAAKEAFIKAWSSAAAGESSASIDLREIEVVSAPDGRPTLRVHGRVAAALQRLELGVGLVSLTHDGNYAAAVVLLQAQSSGRSAQDSSTEP
ncbi:MAG TPA: holo-ACP synthase [Polyangiaceae bacterium]|jgi:holo-[acyl-carrier protein] synthase